MGKTKVKVDKSIKSVILTDVLPFETPLYFSNFGFFNSQTSKKIKIPPFITTVFKKKKQYIPFQFEIKRSERKYRTLSLMHPIIQLDVCNFYCEFGSLIVSACSKSKFSLRKPIRKANYIFIEQDNTLKPIIPTSYFVYKPYKFLYKFFTSFEFNKLEKKYRNYAKIDVSKCFDSIYTHSISWALKDKEFAKENIKNYSFESVFDRLMRNSNHNETNGIIIGPEVSRIFAEIIFQQIDVNVEKKLSGKKYKFNSDYVIKRYVDDYYIFSNNTELIDLIIQIIDEELEFYKLHINDSKTKLINAPFISENSISKIQMSSAINFFYENLFKPSENGKPNYSLNSIKRIRNPQQKSMSLINEIKAVLKVSGATISDISKYTLSIITKKLQKTLDTEKQEIVIEELQKNIINIFITVFLDLIFYITTLDTVTKNTNQLIIIISLIRNYYLKHDLDSLKLVEKRIQENLLLLFQSLNHKNKENSVEVCNIMIALKVLSKDFLLTEDKIKQMFNIKGNEEIKMNYFKVAGLLYYIEDRSQFNSLKINLCKSIIRHYTKSKYLLQNADLFCLFFDFIKCPYIEKDYKKELIEIVSKKYNRTLNNTQKGEIINYINNFTWFVDWNSKVKKLIERKQISFDY